MNRAEVPCTHLPGIAQVEPSSLGCEDCLRIGGRWVHLRMCMHCGHVGCCDNSPNRHATGQRDVRWRADAGEIAAPAAAITDQGRNDGIGHPNSNAAWAAIDAPKVDANTSSVLMPRRRSRSATMPRSSAATQRVPFPEISASLPSALKSRMCMPSISIHPSAPIPVWRLQIAHAIDARSPGGT